MTSISFDGNKCYQKFSIALSQEQDYVCSVYLYVHIKVKKEKSIQNNLRHLHILNSKMRILCSLNRI